MSRNMEAMNTRSEFVSLLGKDVCDCMEYAAKYEWRNYFIDLKARLMLLYEQSRQRNEPYTMRAFYGQFANDCQKDIKRLTRRIKQLERGEEQNGITEEEIRAAKDYPIGELLRVNSRTKARCVHHTDTRPSMDCRNNFAHCYVCGWSGDTIAVYMKIHGVSFPEAVRSLNGQDYT